MNRALILMYHAVDSPLSASEARYCVEPASFRAQMGWLATSGKTVVPLAAIVGVLQRGETPCGDCVAITFDDGFECFQRNALPVLKEFRLPSTMFAVAGKLGESNSWMQQKGWPLRRLMNAEELRVVQAHGVTIGCHGFSHIPMTDVTDNELRRESVEARQTLSTAIGRDVTLFAYPHGAAGERERKAVAAAGFAAACSTQSGFNGKGTDLYALRRIDIYGSDTLTDFRRKFEFGANRVTRTDVALYYFNRLRGRFHA
jgi:peptidoglycan/xylan/chitin deacetylase (PgdA/CDA1 family)